MCAVYLNGTRNENRILPKQGLIIEKNITVDINRNPTAELKILSAANYSESYIIDVLPILKQYNCYIVDYLIVNEELYLLGRSNDTIPNMKLRPLLLFKINDTSLVSNVIGYDLDKRSVSLDYVDGKIIVSNRDEKYIIDTNLSASKIVNTDQRSVRQANNSKYSIENDKVMLDAIIPRELYVNGKVGDTYLLTISPLNYAKPNMNLPSDFFKAQQHYGIPIYENMMVFWNVKTDEMERYENLDSITSFNFKYMDMHYDTKRFERWNQIIQSTSSEKEE